MLSTHSTDIWKFVDDVSTSENILKNSESEIQSSLNVINSWATCNFMKLNPKKCKELPVCFLRETPDCVLSPFLIDGHALAVVRSYKVLGLVIQNDFKWNNTQNQSYLRLLSVSIYYPHLTAWWRPYGRLVEYIHCLSTISFGVLLRCMVPCFTIASFQ